VVIAPPLHRRLGSLLYDWLVADAVVLLVVAIFSLITTAAPGLSHRRSILLAVCFLTLGGYFIYCWVNGQTLAMRVWRMRIEDANGRPLTPGRACVRYVLAWVWIAPPLALVAALKSFGLAGASMLEASAGAVFIWAIVWSALSLLRADRQFWHDVLAGTRLVPA
jgi:uncharacterized RDD family membrane protein YckC